MSEFVRRCEDIMCERHERLLVFFRGLYEPLLDYAKEAGIPTQEVIEKLAKEDWANELDGYSNKWGWCFWKDTEERLHAESVEEDLEQLHMRGYIYIDASGQIWPTARARLTLGQ